LILGPGAVPWVTESTEAERVPELAVLSALAHSNEPRGIDVVVAALGVAERLDKERAKFYTGLVHLALNEAVRKQLESLMRSVPEGFKPSEESMRILEYFRKLRTDAEAEGKVVGEAQGRALGEVRGTAQAVIRVLAARGIVVSDLERERILSCTDRETLDQWIERAVRVTSVAEMIG
jgi:hypothetical protein